MLRIERVKLIVKLFCTERLSVVRAFLIVSLVFSE